MIISRFEQHINHPVVLDLLVFVKVIADRLSDVADGFVHNIVNHHDSWNFPVELIGLASEVQRDKQQDS